MTTAPDPVAQGRQGTILSGHTATLAEHTTTLAEHGSKLDRIISLLESR